MRAYKCDICGKLFYGKKPFLKIFEASLDVICNLNGSKYDICAECVEAIQKVIDERSKENEQHNA